MKRDDLDPARGILVGLIVGLIAGLLMLLVVIGAGTVLRWWLHG